MTISGINGLQLSVIALIASFAAVQPVAAQNEARSPVVIELFTSQGCSSCPSADRLIGELSKQPGVIAMSYPVTYWDYLGWKDTLAKPGYNQRQRDYAEKHGEMQVYTPQAIVNGLVGGVGSSRNEIDAAIKSTGPAIQKAAVPLTVRRDGEKFVIQAGAAPTGSAVKTGQVWVASIMRSADVDIKRGENAGRRVTYTNVVRKLTDAGNWQGAPTAYSLPVSASLAEDGDTVVVFLQGDRLGPIVGAARMGG